SDVCSSDLLNGTDPCSAADQPADADGDFVSDRLDPDDDNDGTPDLSDPLALDPDDGSTTKVPAGFTWDNDAPSPGGILDLGFTGSMVNGSTDYLDTYDYANMRSEEHTSELQSRENLVCRLLLEKKNKKGRKQTS